VSDTQAWLRRAGWLEAGGGETVLWSVAEGHRGRRWRSLRLDDRGGVLSSLVLELDPGGHWTRLELASSAGMLTLHPDPDERAAHGNLVTARGVVPLEFPWSPGHVLALPGESIAAAALGRAAGGHPRPGLVVEDDLTVIPAESVAPLLVPEDGLPGPSWALEP
jgi:hypothetical protein